MCIRDSCYNDLREKEPELPEYERFRADGIYRYQNNRPVIAFEQQRLDPEQHPLSLIHI